MPLVVSDDYWDESESDEKLNLVLERESDQPEAPLSVVLLDQLGYERARVVLSVERARALLAEMTSFLREAERLG